MSFRLRVIVCLVGGFLLLQAADFLFTWLLLSGAARADVYESNPLARSILDRAGWLGLAAFKLSITAVALTAGLAVLRRRPAAGLRLLTALCLLMLGVNVYSGTLLASPPGTPEERQALAREKTLDRQFVDGRQFFGVRDALLDAVLAGHITPQDARQQLADHIRHYSPLLRLPPAGRLPDPARPEELAAYWDYHLSCRAEDRGLSEIAVSVRQPANDSTFDPMTPVWLRLVPRSAN
jgi:hypothetical protein